MLNSDKQRYNPEKGIISDKGSKLDGKEVYILRTIDHYYYLICFSLDDSAKTYTMNRNKINKIY